MNKRCLIFTVGLCLAASTACWAFDRIQTAKGTVSGRYISMSPYKITIDKNGVDTDVPVNEVITLFYDREPAELANAKRSVMDGRYEETLEALAGIPANELTTPEMQQDVVYYKAFCNAKLALVGSKPVVEAGREMATFAGANTGSYHYLEACELVGDLLVAMRNYPAAETYYGIVAKAPWPDYKMRAGVAIGRARLAQNKIDEAKAAFQAVVSNTATGDLAETQRAGAKLGLAQCQAASGQQDEAIAAIQKILADADPENVPLHARGNNTLGTALRKAGRDKEALLAFLQVDILYFQEPDAHAEALFNLAQLWETMHHAERAAEARTTLKNRYPNSVWNR